MKAAMKSVILAMTAVTLLGLTACGGKHSSPNYVYMPDMAYSPAIKTQSGAKYSMMLPVKGTVPRGYVPFHYTDIETAGKELKNPLRRTTEVLKRGQAVFNTYCIVCHGPAGEGDGYVVPKYPRPPSLQSDKIRNYPDGKLYYVMTKGQNIMPSYASQIAPVDRWAIAHYVRALQRSKHPTAEDLKEAEAE